MTRVRAFALLLAVLLPGLARAEEPWAGSQGFFRPADLLRFGVFYYPEAHFRRPRSSSGRSRNAMPHVRLVAIVVLGLSTLVLAAQQPAAAPPGAPGPVLSAQRLDDRIIVRVDDRTFTCYRFGSGQKYPYFYPVNGPLSGVSVTTESSLPWPHHRSLFFGSDKVNGGNYWQEGNEEGQIVSRGPTVTVAGPDRVEIADECEWRKPGTAPILIDKREIRIEAPSPQLRTLRFRVTLVPQTEVRIEKTNHSLFAARVTPELSAQAGGLLQNAAGAQGEKGTYGTASPWCDVSGTRFGLREGIALFDSPRNRWYPSKWFTRDYGFFSPTPFNWLDDAGLRLAKGETLELEYMVVVHAGNAAEAGVAELFAKWAGDRAATTAGDAGYGSLTAGFEMLPFPRGVVSPFVRGEVGTLGGPEDLGLGYVVASLGAGLSVRLSEAISLRGGASWGTCGYVKGPVVHYGGLQFRW